MTYLQSPLLVETRYIAIFEKSWLSCLTTNLCWKAALQWNCLNCSNFVVFFWLYNSCNAKTLIYGSFFWSWNQIKYTVVCLNISFSKNLCHIETIQLICIKTQLTGLYTTWFFTEINFRRDFDFKYRGCSFLIITKDCLVKVSVLLNVCLMLWT